MPFADVVVGWVLEANVKQSRTTVALPVYSSALRELHIMNVDAECGQSTADDWILRGTAVYLVTE